MSGKKFPIEPESVSVRIGKANVHKLRDLAIKESVRRNSNITPADIVKEALEKTFPKIFCSSL